MILLIANTKGGVGKSTLAVNLAARRAVELQKTDKKLLLIDADKQKNTSNWANTRFCNQIFPKISCHEVTDKLMKFELESEVKHYSDIVIDCGGFDSPAMRHAMIGADKMISPFKASQFDLDALDYFCNLVDQADEARETHNKDGLPAAFLQNMKSSNTKSRAHKNLEAYLKNYREDFPIGFMEATIGHRAAFEHCVEDGLAVFEMKKRNRPAMFELECAYAEIWES